MVESRVVRDGTGVVLKGDEARATIVGTAPATLPRGLRAESTIGRRTGRRRDLNTVNGSWRERISRRRRRNAYDVVELTLIRSRQGWRRRHERPRRISLRV